MGFRLNIFFNVFLPFFFYQKVLLFLSWKRLSFMMKFKHHIKWDINIFSSFKLFLKVWIGCRYNKHWKALRPWWRQQLRFYKQYVTKRKGWAKKRILQKVEQKYYVEQKHITRNKKNQFCFFTKTVLKTSSNAIF